MDTSPRELVDMEIIQGFPGFAFWKFLPQKPCSGLSTVNGKSP